MESLASNPDNTRSFCVAEEEEAGKAPSLTATEATCCITARHHVLTRQEEAALTKMESCNERPVSLQVRMATFPFLLLRVSGCRTCGAKKSLLNVFQALRVLTPWCSELPKRIGGSEFSPIKKR